jgi:hypothetical protein
MHNEKYDEIILSFLKEAEGKILRYNRALGGYDFNFDKYDSLKALAKNKHLAESLFYYCLSIGNEIEINKLRRKDNYHFQDFFDLFFVRIFPAFDYFNEQNTLTFINNLKGIFRKDSIFQNSVKLPVSHILKIVFPLTKKQQEEIKNILDIFFLNENDCMDFEIIYLLRKLLSKPSFIPKYDQWGVEVNKYCMKLPIQLQSEISYYFDFLLTATSTKPSKKWLASLNKILSQFEIIEFRKILTICLKLLKNSREKNYYIRWGMDFSNNFLNCTNFNNNFEYDHELNQWWCEKMPWQYLQKENNTLLKGLIWTAATFQDDKTIALLGDVGINAYKKISCIGSRSTKGGNSVVERLSSIGTKEAAAQLVRIRDSVEKKSVKKKIDTILKTNFSKISFTNEVIDEIPDFGYTKNGLVLNTGDRIIYAILNPEGKLQFRNETGKITKTFPKQKKNENKNTYNEAKSRLRIFKKSITPVLKQQSIRLNDSFMTSHFYPFKIWSKIFWKHPLLAHLLQGVIWTQQPEKRNQKINSFRISEDLSLISSDDNNFSLCKNDLIGFWHPIYATSEELADWQQHFKDYQLKDFLSQLTRTIYYPDDQEKKGNHIIRYKGCCVQNNKLKSSFKKLGYQPQIAHGLSACSHEKYYSSSGVIITIEHSDLEVYYVKDELTKLGLVKIDVTGKYREIHNLPADSTLTLDKLPKVLVSSIIEQMEEIIRK